MLSKKNQIKKRSKKFFNETNESGSNLQDSESLSPVKLNSSKINQDSFEGEIVDLDLDQPKSDLDQNQSSRIASLQQMIETNK